LCVSVIQNFPVDVLICRLSASERILASHAKVALTEAEKNSSRFFMGWRAKSAIVRDALKLPPGSKPWTSRPEVKLRGVADSERQRDLLDVAWADSRNKNPGLASSELCKILWANPSQGLQRRPWSWKPQTLTTSCELYSYEGDCVISGAGHMRAMGWPNNCVPIDEFSESDVRSLAGESYRVPIACIATNAFYLNPYAPWCGTR
jgi:hypothetical protein